MGLVSATTSAIIGFVLLLAGIPKLNEHDGSFVQCADTKCCRYDSKRRSLASFPSRKPS